MLQSTKCCISFLLAFCYQNQMSGNKVLEIKAAYKSWTPIHSSSSAPRGRQKVFKADKICRQQVSCQLKQGLFQLAIIKVNCLDREGQVVLTLGPGEWQLLQSSWYINLFWPRSRKILNRSVIERVFLFPLNLDSLAGVNGNYFTPTAGQGQLAAYRYDNPVTQLPMLELSPLLSILKSSTPDSSWSTR